MATEFNWCAGELWEEIIRNKSSKQNRAFPTRRLTSARKSIVRLEGKSSICRTG